ncbi:DUF4928 family protein [Actinokineospora iranica]|uniref:DUF4928 domain-containing protein n=1 Tax=Actinokineospora iranica TaxID=1271860 RepID=A0A1G6LKY5_9PSEU|nr:DUF4928 family protein [Actinokineospora iranica]SDC43849.1 protein of unknown function [Actinokineospora iranica]
MLVPELPPRVDEVVNGFLREIAEWYEEQRKADGRVNTNVMTVGLILLHHMGSHYPLEDDHYLTSSQVKGISGSRIASILAAHDEHRKFTTEGGRTSRGTMQLARSLARLLNECPEAADYEELLEGARAEVRFRLQGWFVGRVQQDYFDQRFIEATDLDSSKPTKAAVAALLSAARLRGGSAAGALAQHLVGAKLSLRFPQLTIGNEKYTTADQQTDRPGDFKVGDTAFHVTMSPSDGLFRNRCRSNLHHGFRPVVLVPADRVSAALQLAENEGIADRVAVNSIEDFVGTNIDEMAVYETHEIRLKLRELLERYNVRVRSVEPDPSFQIAIPENL